MTASGIRTVARQEFRLRIRAGRWRLLLAVWFTVLLLFTLLLSGAFRGLSQTEVVDRGVVVYGGLMLFVLGLALLVVPNLAAQSVNGDRERGTLATLQVTRLSAAEITLGKFLAAWGTALVFLALTLPLVAYAVTLGGVTPGRVLVLTVVLALLLGTVCAISLALSALLSRTTTSGVLAYLSVFALTVGTLVVFGLVTAVTTERYTETFPRPCPSLAELPPDVPEEVREEAIACVPGTESFETSRARTDRTWFLLAPNPFVVLADAAPRLPEETPAERRAREERESRGVYAPDARDLDPLGQIGRNVRDLRRDPSQTSSIAGGAVSSDGMLLPEEAFVQEEPPPVWPFGLAVDVALGAGALWLTTRRLRTPSRALPQGQRVA